MFKKKSRHHTNFCRTPYTLLMFDPNNYGILQLTQISHADSFNRMKSPVFIISYYTAFVLSP